MVGGCLNGQREQETAHRPAMRLGGDLWAARAALCPSEQGENPRLPGSALRLRPVQGVFGLTGEQ